MDRMRESLFAILGDLSGCSFLDLFSGSGIIGIEAASRGAEPVICVEKDRKKRDTLLSNISIVETRIELRMMGAEQFIKGCSASFDYIFLDPPFSLEGKEKFIEGIALKGILVKGGKLLIHHPKEEKLKENIGSLQRVDTRRYGGSSLEIYK